MTARHRYDPFAPTLTPAPFPRGAEADVFPLPADQAVTLIAITVFTVYPLPRRPTEDNPYPVPAVAARCACGDTWRHDSRVLLRRILGGHSCAAETGRPIELVPVDDEPAIDTLTRVLDGLRRL